MKESSVSCYVDWARTGQGAGMLRGGRHRWVRRMICMADGDGDDDAYVASEWLI